MDQTRLNYLIGKYKDGRLSSVEAEELDNWFHSLNLTDTGFDEWIVEAGGEKQMAAALFEDFNERLTDNKKDKKIRRMSWSIAAASILAILSAGTIFLLRPKNPQQKLAQVQKQDIAPGHNQATLTLANGQKIILTTGLKGKLAVQNQTVISATQNTVTYHINQPADQFSYNTLSTAKGEQSPYPLVLADGTKVWLNAASSITFPTAFNQKDRIVKLTGEAYFEIAHNARQPFKVQTEKQTIEDIGTAFDVNAYTDEPATKTTLIEGSVRVNNLVLKPNEQTDGKNIKTVNTEMITAWKNGRFHFEGDDIQTVMRQLVRWYNIDVTYQGEPTKNVFYAGISRQRNISAVLKLLENTNGVHFKIEGRRVTVIE